MPPDAPHPNTSVMHATVGLETIRALPMPSAAPNEDNDYIQKQQQLERDLFCTVYSGLLDDVETLDRQLESKFSKEIIRIVCTFAASFAVENQEFSQRLERLNHKSQQIGPVQGLSGATVVDYLVALMTEKSGWVKLNTLGNYQYQLTKLNLAKAIREFLADKKLPMKYKARKALLRSIGLPSVLFICIGPHKHNQNKREDPENQSQDKKNQDKKDEGERGGRREVESKDEGEEGTSTGNSSSHHAHPGVPVHVIASSAEAFADTHWKRWAARMHYERMRSVSAENYEQVCTTERAFFTTPAPPPNLAEVGEEAEKELEKVRRANIVPHWQTMHHWPDASATASTADGGSGTGAHIGVFNHAGETAGAFNVHSGFERRARCFKCASVYLYRQDVGSVRAEADMNGPHRHEPIYNWLVDDRDGEQDGDDPKGPTCAEALGHLLCSEIM